MTSPVPQGCHTVNVHLSLKGAGDAIDFYKKAFGAEEILRLAMPDGQTIMHAEIRIGDCTVMLAEDMPMNPGVASPQALGGTSVCILLYVDDADAWFQRAVDAGCEANMPVSDMFWGDRYGMVTCPFGHRWEIATHTKDLTPEEIGKAAQEFFSSMGPGGPC